MKTKKILILLCFIVSTRSYSNISTLDFDNISLDTLDDELNSQYDQEIATTFAPKKPRHLRIFNP